MKIETTHTVETDMIGEFKSAKSSIDDKDIGMVLKMVSENLYSNPIGSFIREITSNAVDANMDANEVSPVMVHAYHDDGAYYIEFKDKGRGMSPEIYNNIYMKWFNSDKRESNEKIGGWGIGSKSPLAYQDFFYITTVFDGIKYEYIFSKGEELPESDLINTEETDESNGTTIKIELKEGDEGKVHLQAVKQLVYFNNVYYKNEKYYYDNHFKIYESDNYKLRSRDRPFGDEMHISLGQVAYPINWQTIGLGPVRIPVALKFEIGELAVTISREEINYTKEVKQRIIDKVQKVSHDLNELYQSQLHIDDLFSYVRMLKNGNKPDLVIKDVSIPMNVANANLTFSPFGVSIAGKKIRDLFLSYEVIRLLNGKRYFSKGDSYKYHHHLYNNTDNCYILDGKFNYFDSKYINHGYLFKKRKLNKHDYRSLASVLGLVVITRTRYDSTSIYVEGASKKILEAIKFIDNYLNQKLKKYIGTAPEEWIAEEKAKTKVKSERVKGEITYYDVYNTRGKIKVRELVENNKIVFYMSRNEDTEKILAHHALYQKGNTRFQKKTTFIIVSETVAKQISKNKNVIHAANILKIGSYRNTLIRMRITSKFANKVYNHKAIFAYSDYYKQKFIKADSLYRKDTTVVYRNIPVEQEKQNFTINIPSYFEEDITKLKPSNYRKSLPYEDEVNELAEFVQKCRILQYIDPTKVPHAILVNFIKSLKVLKLDSKYYDENYSINP